MCSRHGHDRTPVFQSQCCPLRQSMHNSHGLLTSTAHGQLGQSQTCTVFLFFLPMVCVGPYLPVAVTDPDTAHRCTAAKYPAHSANRSRLVSVMSRPL